MPGKPLESTTEKTEASYAYAVFTPCQQSHTFEDRRIPFLSEEPIKIGRAVAKLRPCPDNAIFDCKVLSRNHAAIWYEDGKVIQYVYNAFKHGFKYPTKSPFVLYTYLFQIINISFHNCFSFIWKIRKAQMVLLWIINDYRKVLKKVLQKKYFPVILFSLASKLLKTQRKVCLFNLLLSPVTFETVFLFNFQSISVTHGCIICIARLYDSDNREAPSRSEWVIFKIFSSATRKGKFPANI